MSSQGQVAAARATSFPKVSLASPRCVAGLVAAPTWHPAHSYTCPAAFPPLPICCRNRPHHCCRVSCRAPPAFSRWPQGNLGIWHEGVHLHRLRKAAKTRSPRRPRRSFCRSRGRRGGSPESLVCPWKRSKGAHRGLLVGPCGPLGLPPSRLRPLNPNPARVGGSRDS